MRILVAAKELRLDRGSEGICSSKFVVALANGGHDVTCLTSENLDDFGVHADTLPWLGKLPIRHVAAEQQRGWNSLANGWTAQLASRGSVGAYVARRINSASAYSSGHHLSTWEKVECWEQALRRAVEAIRPNLVITRGAGLGFEPHLAMLRWRCPVPWIGNYHDPYPVSLYPEPYRHRTPIVSYWQESQHRQILEAADALTFPSQRLLEWILKGPSARHRQKAFVVPHIASGVFDRGADLATCGLPLPAGDEFLIVHMGTLLNGREPWALLRGFHEFVQQDKEKQSRARLMLVGKVNPRHASHPDWKRLVDGDRVIVWERRITYPESLELMRAATASVVLEANTESPFFPGKLTDCLWLRKPILALSPRQSTTADLLGADYPLLVSPDDTRGVKQSLDRLWTQWKQGSVAALTPAKEIGDGISEGTVVGNLRRLFDRLLVHDSKERHHANDCKIVAAGEQVA